MISVAEEDRDFFTFPLMPPFSQRLLGLVGSASELANDSAQSQTHISTGKSRRMPLHCYTGSC